jgi:uncharacterized protein YecT (DUF1311 family)
VNISSLRIKLRTLYADIWIWQITRIILSGSECILMLKKGTSQVRVRIRSVCVVVVVALAMVNTCVYGQNCDRPGTVQEMTECATLRQRAAEREIAEVYGALLDSEDKEFVKVLKDAQDAWMRWREVEGKLAMKTVTDQALAQYALKVQEAQMTEDRIKDLRSISVH